MLIKVKDQQAIARGEVSLAFRRWKRPTVKTGGTLRTSVGLLAIGDVTLVEATEISQAEAQRAGFSSRRALVDELNARSGGRLYRIELSFAGADPREELRNRADLTGDDVSEIVRRLARFDQASPRGPWTAMALQLIAQTPATRAAELAAEGGFETRWFKTRVRQLKELGLTESLEVGYRLSPRGRAFLRSTG